MVAADSRRAWSGSDPCCTPSNDVTRGGSDRGRAVGGRRDRDVPETRHSDGRPTLPATGTDLRLPATPDTCYRGYLDVGRPAGLEVETGAELWIEAVTHHAGDAPDLLMDDGIRADLGGHPRGHPQPRRAHHDRARSLVRRRREPGDTLVVRHPRHGARACRTGPTAPPTGVCSTNAFGKERITIYELAGDASPPGSRRRPSPRFGFDFTTRRALRPARRGHPARPRHPGDPSRSTGPGTGPSALRRDGSGSAGARSHQQHPAGRVGAATSTTGASGPAPSCAIRCSPRAPGFFVGDPHFAQGDGEICGTAIEASLERSASRSRSSKDLATTAPVMQHGDPCSELGLRASGARPSSGKSGTRCSVRHVRRAHSLG